MQPATVRGPSNSGILQLTAPAPAGALEEKERDGTAENRFMDSKNSGQLAMERLSNTISQALAPLQPLVDPLGLFSGAGGSVLTGRQRQREVCRWFAIPETEVLLDEFHCALRKSVLLQGRIYIFEHYLCFSSNVFGYLKKKVIKFEDVIAVRKKSHFRFPNSIEVEVDVPGMATSQREFFTSFLSRDEAYRLIMQCWSTARPGAHISQRQGAARVGAGSPDVGGPAILHEVGDGCVAPRPRQTSLMGMLMRRSQEGHDAHHTTSADGGVMWLMGGRRNRTRTEPTSNDATPVHGRTDMMLGAGAQLEGSPVDAPKAGSLSCDGLTRGGPGGEASTPTAATPGGSSLGPSAERSRPPGLRLGTISGRDSHSDDGSCDDEDGDEDGDLRMLDVVEAWPAPALAPDAKAVVSDVLQYTTIRDFFRVLLSNSSHFLEDFLESQGNRRINVKAWRRHEQLGHVRDVTFVAPIKGAFASWGIPHTQCYQSQRFAQYSGEHLVFETSQTMANIPYGDCFTVDIRWDVKPIQAGPSSPSAAPPCSHPPTSSQLSVVLPSDAPCVRVEVSMRVVFSRKCLFKKVIESGSHKQVTETYTALIASLKDVLLDRWNQSMAAKGPTAAGDVFASISRGEHVMGLSSPGLSMRRGSGAQYGPASGMTPLGPSLGSGRGLMGARSASLGAGLAGQGDVGEQGSGSVSATTSVRNWLWGLVGVRSGSGGGAAGGGAGGLASSPASTPKASVGAHGVGLSNLGKVHTSYSLGHSLDTRARSTGFLAGLSQWLLGEGSYSQRRSLVVSLVMIMFLVQCLMALGVFWVLLFPQSSFTSSVRDRLVTAIAGSSAGGHGSMSQPLPEMAVAALERSYYEQRLGLLQNELGLLQQRISLVTGEIATAMAQLGNTRS